MATVFSGNGVGPLDQNLLKILGDFLRDKGVFLQEAGRNCGENKFKLILSRRQDNREIFLLEKVLYDIIDWDKAEGTAGDLASYFVVKNREKLP